MTKRWLSALALLFLCLVPGHGQFMRYQRYLDNEEIRCLAVNADKAFDSQVWVGLSNGFAVIGNKNEMRFSTIHTRSGDMAIGAVLGIVPNGKEAILWTETAMLRFNLSDESYERVNYADMPISVISKAMRDGDVLYLLIQDGILKYKFSDRSIEQIYRFADHHNFTYVDIARSSGNEPDVLMLGSDEDGIFTLSTADYKLEKLEGIPGDIMADLSFFDSMGGLNVVPKSGGVLRYPTREYVNNPIRLNESANTPLSNNTIIDIDETDEFLAIASEGASINIVDKVTSQVERVFSSPVLQSQRDLLSLPGHNFVVGTEFNGVIFCRNSYLSTLSSGSVNSDLNLSNSTVLSAYNDDQGNLWIGTDNGINRYHSENYWDGKVDYFPQTDKFKVISIIGYGRDRILFCTSHRGLFLMDKATGNVSRFNFPNVEFDSRRNRTSKMKLLGGPDGKVFLFNASEGVHYSYNPARGSVTRIDAEILGNEEVVNIIPGGLRAIIQTASSICEFDCTNAQMRRIYTSGTNTIQFSCQSLSRSIFFAEDDVIKQYYANTNDVREVCKLDLDGAVVRALCADSHQNIWATTSDGRLFFCDLLDGSVKIFNYTDFGRNIFTSMFSVADRNRLYLSGALGLMVIDSYSAYEDLEPIVPNLTLLSVFVDDDAVDMKTIGRRVVLQNNHKALTVKFNVDNSCPLDARLLRISIRRRGKDIYSTITTNPTLDYPNLPYGKMSVMVSTMGTDDWNPEEELLRVKVRMPFMLTGWAIALYILTFVGILLLFRFYFITQKRRELEETRFELENSKSEEKITLMGSIAHDLRSPMSIVFNRVQSAIDALSDERPEISEKLSTTIPQMEKMTEMINTVLAVQKLDNMDQELHFSPVNLNEWVSRTMAEIKPKSDEKGLSLEFVGDPAIQVINTDVGKLAPCLNNLLSNAIKYSAEGTITVATRVLGKFIRVSVTDQGIGFKSDPEKLFTKFYRENNSIVGYGIGLSYVKSLITKLGGNVGALHNESGVGSTFYFEIPVVGNEVVSAYTSITRGTGNVMFDTSKMTLLVVDDQSDVLDMLKSEYGSKFKKVLTAGDGMEAFLVVRDKHPDVIVSDLKMPKMDGFEFCKAVKSNVDVSHIPFIMLSSNSEALRRKMSYKLGPDDYLDKPFDIKVLYNLIKAHLKIREDIREECRSGKTALIYENHTYSYADEQFIAGISKAVMSFDANEKVDKAAIAKAMGIPVKTLVQKIDILSGLSPEAYARRVIDAAE